MKLPLRQAQLIKHESQDNEGITLPSISETFPDLCGPPKREPIGTIQPSTLEFGCEQSWTLMQPTFERPFKEEHVSPSKSPASIHTVTSHASACSHTHSRRSAHRRLVQLQNHIPSYQPYEVPLTSKSRKDPKHEKDRYQMHKKSLREKASRKEQTDMHKKVETFLQENVPENILKDMNLTRLNENNSKRSDGLGHKKLDLQNGALTWMELQAEEIERLRTKNDEIWERFERLTQEYSQVLQEHS